MPKPSSFGWRKPICLLRANHALLVAESILELKEEMKCYVSFPDKAITSSVVLPEEPSTTQPKDSCPRSGQTRQTDSPVEEATAKITEELTKKEQPPESVPWVEGGVTPLQASSCSLGRFLPSCEALNEDPVVEVPGRGWYQ